MVSACKYDGEGVGIHLPTNSWAKYLPFSGLEVPFYHELVA